LKVRIKGNIGMGKATCVILVYAEYAVRLDGGSWQTVERGNCGSAWLAVVVRVK
jgi:hypothetical protein